MKRLLLDINSIVPYFIQGHLPGVGRSTMELLKALEKIDNIPFEIILLSQNLKGIGVKNLDTKFKTKHIWLPNRLKVKRICDRIRLKHLLTKYDLYHIPHNTDTWENLGKTIYTIHDLIVYRYPEMWGLTDKMKHEFQYIAKNCKAIMTCSEASKDDIVHFWNIDPDKVTVVPWGLNRDMFNPDNSDAEYKSIPDITDNFFFCASCNHPRKNTTMIAQAFRKYIAGGGTHQMVLLSPETKELEGYQDLIDSHRIITVKGISDKQLVSLYRNAKASIVVSLYEGFGLPVLESLGCHTQVICAKNSSLTEAGGDVVDYLNDYSDFCLARKLLAYDSITKSESLDINRTEEHLSNFTWEKCAKSYIEFWNKLLNQ